MLWRDRRAARSARRWWLMLAQHGLANLCRLLFNLNEFTFVD